MKNPALITANIAGRFAKEFGRSLTGEEIALVKEASSEALRKIRGRTVRKLVTEKIGTGNGLCRFEDIASGKDTDIRRAIHKEVMECILEIAKELGPSIGKSAIEFVKEWEDMDEYERVLVPLVAPKENRNAVAQRKWRKAHRDAATKNMREWRMNRKTAE